MLTDPFGRPITYLRISLTPRCNLRCVYCMPAEGLPPVPAESLLTNDEIVSVVTAAVAAGIRKVRLTGGEPLLRRGLVDLVGALAALPDLEEVTLTTNGMLLARLAPALAAAGLARVNVSLDTLDPEKFRRITRGGQLARALEGIRAAEAAGLTPVKLNTVVIRGVNDDELVPLARLTRAHPWHVCFIELMPVGNQADWGPGFPAHDRRYLSVGAMHAALDGLGLVPAERPAGNGPARTFRIPAAPGTIGFISPLGDHFCARCNRLRLTADGRLIPCLLHEAEVSAREALRVGAPVLPLLRRAVRLKPESHRVLDGMIPERRRMVQIGG